jgi:hypothetical protein
MMFSSPIHLPANDKISFFFEVELNTIVHKYHIFLTRSSVGGNLGCFHTFTIVNNADINMMYRCFHCHLTYIPLGITLGVEGRKGERGGKGGT